MTSRQQMLGVLKRERIDLMRKAASAAALAAKYHDMAHDKKLRVETRLRWGASSKKNSLVSDEASILADEYRDAIRELGDKP